MVESLSSFDRFIHQEMLVHPALFTHAKAHKIAIIGENAQDVAQEAIKHASLQIIWQVSKHAEANTDSRVKTYSGTTAAWLTEADTHSFDLIIVADNNETTTSEHYLKALSPDGILVQKTVSAFAVEKLKTAYTRLLQSGFSDIRIIHFPQPSLPTGWCAALMAIKHGGFRRIREKDIFNKTFSTRYYNYDIHKAALVLPEFMRTELEIE